MSKIYDKYLELKKKDDTKMYLFRVGNFYIFLNEDTHKINEYMVLKLTYFARDVEKCGFPIQSLENYQRIFEKQNLNVEIIENNEIKTDEEKVNNIIKRLNKINIDEITPLNAIIELAKLKEIINGK